MRRFESNGKTINTAKLFMNIKFIKERGPTVIARKLQWIIIAGLLLASMFYQFSTLLSSNCIWLLIAAKRWLAGGTYYHDFVENNPPLIIYISAIAISIAKFLHTDLQTALRIFVFSLSLFVIIFSDFFLELIFDHQQKIKIVIIMIALAIIFWMMPAAAFAEREHLAVILVIPFIFCLTLRCQQKSIPLSSAVFAGFLAAVGFGLKPHFLLAFAFMELYALLQTKTIKAWFNPECLTIYITLIAYFISIYILTPTYMQKIYPMVVNFYLNYEKNTFNALIIRSELISMAIALLLPILFFRKIEKECRHLLWLVYLSLISFFAAYLIQRKIWFYHLLPVFSFTFLLLTIVFLSFKNPPHKMQGISDGKESGHFFKGSLDPALKHGDCASPPVQYKRGFWQRALTALFLLCVISAFVNLFISVYPKNKISLKHSRSPLANDIKQYAGNKPVYYFTTELADFSYSFF